MAAINKNRDVPFEGDIVEKIKFHDGGDVSISFIGGKSIYIHTYPKDSDGYNEKDYKKDFKRHKRTVKINDLI